LKSLQGCIVDNADILSYVTACKLTKDMENGSGLTKYITPNYTDSVFTFLSEVKCEEADTAADWLTASCMHAAAGCRIQRD